MKKITKKYFPATDFVRKVEKQKSKWVMLGIGENTEPIRPNSIEFSPTAFEALKNNYTSPAIEDFIEKTEAQLKEKAKEPEWEFLKDLF